MKKENKIDEKSTQLRSKAEQKLKSQKTKLTEIFMENEADVKKLVHELEVHQIELEMQNDELRKAQLKLEETSQKYFDLYDLAPVGYLTLDEKGTILELNLTAAALLGDNRASIINQNLNSFITRKDRDIFYLHMEKVKKTRSKQSCELKFIKKDGIEFYVHLIGSPVLKKNAAVLKHRVALVDITVHKNAMEEIEQLAMFPSKNPNPVMRITGNGDVLFYNKACEPLLDQLQYQKDKPLPENWSCLARECIETNKVKTLDAEIDEKVFSFTFAPIGEKDFLNVYGLDITKRKRADDEIKISREHLKTINKTLRHDLTNDLSAINSALRLYKRNSDILMLEEIEKKVVKSLTTIERLREKELFISSSNSLSGYKITDILRSIIKDHPDLEIKLEGEGTVLADEGIYSVFENLINNAIMHGKTRKLHISISSLEEFCEIRFADNGKGIPAEIMDKVFDEGFIYGETGHTGIGLYVVRKTIEEFGGKIYCEANDPEGVTFVINLRQPS